jgi:adenylate kinase family enzyme
LDYYQAKNVLFVVDGTREPEDIYADIEKAVKSEK